MPNLKDRNQSKKSKTFLIKTKNNNIMEKIAILAALIK